MKKLLKRILIAFALILTVLALVAGYAYFVEPSRLIIKEVDLKIPRWNEKLNNFKIVAISDLHGGSNNVTESKLREIVEKANAQEPDLIILLGDYVSETSFKSRQLRMPVKTIADNLRGFQAKYGVYAVIGNHDWWHDEKLVRGEFEQVGIKFLENEVREIKVGDEIIRLWGIEDYWKQRRVPTEAFNTIVDKQNIIAITHNPDSLLKSPGEISLMLAGHSHGGQVKFPFYGAPALVNDERFMAGEAVVNGKHVFVTSGVGCSGPQIRLDVPPEIAVLKLFAEN